MKKVTDIDIDFADRDLALQHIPHIPASRVDNGELVKHIVGVYLHDVPVDPITNFCAFDYKTAEANGFFKMDFLNVSVYRDHVKSLAHLEELADREPMWELLDEREFVEQLFHIGDHYDVVAKMKPRSVMQLAMVLALIRPAKMHLIGKPWDEVEKEIWVQTDDAYSFKKSHAVSYAKVIVVQMNALVEEALNAN